MARVLTIGLALLMVIGVTGVLLYYLVLKPPRYDYVGAAPTPLSAQLPAETGWISLFNGTSLDGWTPKFTGHPAGQNFADTWRVEAGTISAQYGDYPAWNGEFGHLFYQQPFRAFVLQLEYRFTGEQATNNLLMRWAWRNSGVMFHSEPAESMALQQQFPVSIEAQLLGRAEGEARTTGNLCTPDTHVILNGKLHTPHCTNSLVSAAAGDRWVRFELDVHPDGTIHHFIDGRFAMAYAAPQLDTGSAGGARLAAGRNADNLTLEGGYIALQAESHPVQFRNIRLYPLDTAR